MKKLFTSMILLVMIIPTVSALSCVAQSPEEEFESTPYIFLGTINASNNKTQEITFVNIESFKGNVSEGFVVQYKTIQHTLTEKGETIAIIPTKGRFLVYAQEAQGVLVTGECNKMIREEYAQEQIFFLETMRDKKTEQIVVKKEPNKENTSEQINEKESEEKIQKSSLGEENTNLFQKMMSWISGLFARN